MLDFRVSAADFAIPRRPRAAFRIYDTQNVHRMCVAVLPCPPYRFGRLLRRCQGATAEFPCPRPQPHPAIAQTVEFQTVCGPPDAVGDGAEGP
ncbi:uncharacterized protein TRAVEDRAFT_29498 [Trametes versicolor FP-101664 SS1]|uniref:uncharacterized protein n=1 Tax=Trametes versicolor (strain FP-101664) TaxID=717944 RepID=UPI00046240C9|nr:uncharacterized protein TRAVEDRAFT_29498 [Trametes versicolor FP-101664 SS1]EIW57383.1 hypothetical protein TRAVEDRAFT_29498 [Trametes versicolor FP-101664 SS1]